MCRTSVSSCTVAMCVARRFWALLPLVPAGAAIDSAFFSTRARSVSQSPERERRVNPSLTLRALVKLSLLHRFDLDVAQVFRLAGPGRQVLGLLTADFQRVRRLDDLQPELLAGHQAV